MPLVPQVHLDVLNERTESGLLVQYVEIHTYESGDLGLLCVHGTNMDNESQSVDIWYNESEIRQLRDAINQVLGETSARE